MPQPPDNRTDIRNDERATLGTTMAGAGTRHSVETLIGRAAVERGLASRNQVLLAFDLIKQYPKEERPARFVEVFVSRGVLTAEQIEMLRGWVTDDGDPSAKSGSSMAAPKVSSAEMIPGYRIERKLGAGAMGTVVLARQLSLDRLVAIKLLPKKFATDAQYIDRFYKEGKAAARLNDPNIVAAYDVGRAPAGEYFFVMEYVDGDTVFDRIQAKRRIGEPEALHIARQAASALRHAHEKGFIHRDVKPKNLMITKGGVVKLADLGLARAGNDSDAATEEKGKIFGTPYYISPEQIRAREVTPATDIYGLGATLYHMVTGNVPFNGKNPSEVMQKHLKSDIVPPDHVNPKLTPGISEIIERMMAKSRKDRYKNCQEMLTDLRAVRRGELPPIAHKEAPASAVLEVIKSSEAVVAPIPEDRSQPKGHSTNPIIVYALIAALCYALIMTVVAIIGLF